MTEANVSSQNCRPGEMHFPSLQHDRLMERQVIELVVFAEKNTEQNCVVWNLHGQIHFIVLRLAAARWPTQTATMQHRTDSPMLAPARNHSPSFIRLRVCRLNDENVV